MVQVLWCWLHQAHHLLVRVLESPVVLSHLQSFPLSVECLFTVRWHSSSLHAHALLHTSGLVSRVVLPKHQAVDGTEPKDIEKVPRHTGDPTCIQRLQLYSSLEHWFESQGQRKWDLGCYKSGEMPIDPTSHHHHWHHAGQVSFQHLHQHAGISHWIAWSSLSLGSCLEKARLFVVKIMLPHQE